MNKSTAKLLMFVIFTLFFSFLNVSAQKSKVKTKTSNTKIVAPTQKVNLPSQIEQAVFDEINFLRSDPQSYVKVLEEMKKAIKDNIVTLSNGSRWKMNEGLPAIDDAISTLNKNPKLKPFILSNGLTKVAGMQLTNLKDDMSLGHFGKDGSDIENRLYKVGTPGERYSENIAYYSTDARSIVLTMLLDDGLKSRSHRKNLLSTQLNEIGIAYGIGKKDVGLCVIVFADRFTENK